MGSTVIAGRPSNTVGDKDSTLVLRGSSIKVQWGNKFIDLIKNGKINVEAEKILKVSDSVDNITSDGLYLIEDLIWISIEGTKILLSGNSENTYISFLTDLKEITAEQKLKALTNIGFYYETLEDAKNAGLTAGLIYVLGTNKIYIVKDGIISEYVMQVSSSPIVMDEEDLLDKIVLGLYIEGSSLKLNKVPYITCSLNLVITHKQLIIENGLYSDDAAENKGFKLYNLYGESYLEVDNVIERNNKTTTKVTHSELLSLIESKKLMPKLYYIITDFQNPWEVSWEDEPLYYEDQFVELNNKTYLIGKRNAMLLMVQAKTYNLLEQLAWSLDNPDWVIHYDPFYKGQLHIFTDEQNNEYRQYGFRHKNNTYLPCKGIITYLKDELDNEGNFNFRLFMFKVGDKWRYCMNYDNTNSLGDFYPGVNNSFFILPEIYVQVFEYLPVLDEQGEIENYRLTYKDQGIKIQKGHNLYILPNANYPNNPIDGNYFELNYIEDESSVYHIMLVNCLINNKFINLKHSVELIGEKTIIGNTFDDLKNIHIETDFKNNILRRFNTDLIFEKGTFEGNELSNFIDVIIDNTGTFKNNKISNYLSLEINSLLKLENIGTFNYNKIEECLNNIVNGLSGDFLNNNIKTIYSEINNSGRIISNTIETINIESSFGVSVSYLFTNNNIKSISGKFGVHNLCNNNTINSINNCMFYEIFSNNIFKDISYTDFNEDVLNNIVEGNISASITEMEQNWNTLKKFSNNIIYKDIIDINIEGSFTNNTIYKNIKNFKATGNIEDCTFNLTVNDFSIVSAKNNIFEYIKSFNIDVPINYAVFHGIIGGEIEISESDKELLSNEFKYKDVYPNIRVVLIPTSVVMRGMILMWNGSTEIPEGWAICNGENGTPNLIDKFIKGSTESGKTGGNEGNIVTLSADNIPLHTHNVALTTSENGDYADTIDYNSNTISSGFSDYGGYNIEYTHDSSDHILNILETIETITIDHSAHTHSVEGTTEKESVDVKSFSIEPEYYALIFIMKL